jgi:hypothetical protein
MWKPVVSTVVVMLLLAGLALNYTAQKEQQADVLTLNASVGAHPRTLVVYHPGLSAVPTRVAFEVAAGLAQNALRVDVAVAGPKAPVDTSAYDAVVVVAPTYGWTPAMPVLDWVEAATLQGRSVAAVITANGQGQKSLDRLTQSLTARGATVVARLMVFRSAPNNEAAYVEDEDQAAGFRRAFELGVTLGAQLKGAGAAAP